MALGAAKAETTLAQTGNILGGDGIVGQQAGQQQIKDGALGVHDAAGQAADRHTVQIAHEEHGTRQHRCAVGDDVRAGVPDGQRGAVVGVHAHAAGGEDELTARRFRLENGGRDARRVVVADLVEGHLTAVLGQLAHEDGGELILDAALEHLAAGGDDGKLLGQHGQHVQDRLTACGSLHGVHLLLFDDQRDDAGTGQFLALFHGQVAVDGGDHHLGRAVHGQQGFAVDFQQAVAVGDELDLSLFRLGAVDILARSGLVQQRGGFVLVEDAGLFLPDVEVFFADGEQHGDVLRLDDMALAETCALELAGNDLGNVVAEHLACRVFGTNQFHICLLLTGPASGQRASRPEPAHLPIQNLPPECLPPPPAAGKTPVCPKFLCGQLRFSASRCP